MKEKIGIVGSGIMGRGIAETCLKAGFAIKIYDIDSAALSRAAEKIKEKVPDEIKRLEICSNLEQFHDCGIVIEAVVEKLEVKKDLFSQMEKIVSKEAILATNTSGISITAIASGCQQRERVIGLHFFNPAPKMQLVEVINGLETNEEVTKRACEFVKMLKKVPIVAKDVPGFVVNKIITPMLNEAMHMLDNGIASKTDIDNAIKLGLGHPMGPLELSDFIGLDTLLHFMENLYEQTALDQYRPSNLLRQKVLAGHLGRKTGQGFYKYD